jgi:hypothetical protein
MGLRGWGESRSLLPPAAPILSESEKDETSCDSRKDPEVK